MFDKLRAINAWFELPNLGCQLAALGYSGLRFKILRLALYGVSLTFFALTTLGVFGRFW